MNILFIIKLKILFSNKSSYKCPVNMLNFEPRVYWIFQLVCATICSYAML